MDLYIYTPDLAQQPGIIDTYRSLRWRRRYFAPGEIELHCPATARNIALLQPDNVIHRLDRGEAAVIEGTPITETTENGEEITVTGRMGSSMLDRRVVYPAITFSGTTEAAMRKVVSDNAITARPLPLLTLGTESGYTAACNFQATGKGVLDVCEALGRASTLGFRWRLDIPNNAWIFEVYRGTDRSVTQSDRPYVIFSDEYGNIDNPAYSRDITGYKNYAYVAGEGEGSARTVVTVDQTGDDLRRELWVDARDLQQGDLSDGDYQALLTQRGQEKLAAAIKSESFSADAIDTENFEYLKDWDLGDIVSFSKWGILLNQRITEVEEVDEGGVITITPTCGSPLPETLDLGDDT